MLLWVFKTPTNMSLAPLSVVCVTRPVNPQMDCITHRAFRSLHQNVARSTCWKHLELALEHPQSKNSLAPRRHGTGESSHHFVVIMSSKTCYCHCTNSVLIILSLHESIYSCHRQVHYLNPPDLPALLSTVVFVLRARELLFF